MSVLDDVRARHRWADPVGIEGTVTALRGMSVLARDLPVVVGGLVEVRASSGPRLAEVVGFDGEHAILMLLGSQAGVRGGDRVCSVSATATIGVGRDLLGRVIDGLGAPIDGGGPIAAASPRPVHGEPIGAMRRRRIVDCLETGVRAIDSMTTVGVGQRMGVFAGPGVGKSTLLGMIARNTSADVNVIALVGERGREVREFIEEALGEEGLARSVVVVSTSEESPLMRVRAAHAASAIAEHFRDEGADVMLMVDSVTRFAHAQRQIGLSVGEPPATRGYTPSVFAALPGLLERAGAVEPDASGRGGGSVTAFYTILVEGDDMTEPVADAVRGILDGHLVLTRRLARRGHYPSIDVLDSVSRLAEEICPEEQSAARREVQGLLAAYAEAEELIQIGAYAAGSNARVDRAIALKDGIDALLTQGVSERSTLAEARDRLIELSRSGAESPNGGGGARRAPAGGRAG